MRTSLLSALFLLSIQPVFAAGENTASSGNLSVTLDCMSEDSGFQHGYAPVTLSTAGKTSALVSRDFSDTSYLLFALHETSTIGDLDKPLGKVYTLVMSRIWNTVEFNHYLDSNGKTSTGHKLEDHLAKIKGLTSLTLDIWKYSDGSMAVSYWDPATKKILHHLPRVMTLSTSYKTGSLFSSEVVTKEDQCKVTLIE